MESECASVNMERKCSRRVIWWWSLAVSASESWWMSICRCSSVSGGCSDVAEEDDGHKCVVKKQRDVVSWVMVKSEIREQRWASSPQVSSVVYGVSWREVEALSCCVKTEVAWVVMTWSQRTWGVNRVVTDWSIDVWYCCSSVANVGSAKENVWKWLYVICRCRR